MTLRAKLLLALLPLGTVLALVGVFAVYSTAHLGRYSQNILKDNYVSVLTMERAKEEIERIESSVMLELIRTNQMNIDQIKFHRDRFEQQLRIQEGNITEPGETQLTQNLHDRWLDYQGNLDRLMGILAVENLNEARQFFIRELETAFVSVKKSADLILALNQDTMVQKSERARKQAERMQTLMMIAGLLALVFGAYGSITLTTRILRPVSLLTQTVRRLGQGDFNVRAQVPGKDEIAELAKEFNEMADSLNHYRQSSLGELLQAQQSAQASIDSLPDPVLVFDAQIQLLNFNEVAELWLKLGASNGDQKNIAQLDEPVKKVLFAVCQHVLSGKGAYHPKGFEEAIRVPMTEQDKYLLPRACALYDSEGSINGVTVLLQDVTRLYRFDELKTDLVATVAHEFRTPLTSLRMAVHLCLEHTAGPINEKQTELLDAARHDCERLQNLVDDLLELIRIDSGKVQLRTQPLLVQTLIDLAVDMHRQAAIDKAIQITVDVDLQLRDILGDPDRLPLVLDNVLGNAIKYTPPSGFIHIQASNQGNFVKFEVTDNGPGIRPEFQERIFEKFFRAPNAPEGGAGLGLYISREIIHSHRGEMGVNSESDKGTTFWFTVPIAIQEA